jgi:hypothetical protein
MLSMPLAEGRDSWDWARDSGIASKRMRGQAPLVCVGLLMSTLEMWPQRREGNGVALPGNENILTQDT